MTAILDLAPPHRLPFLGLWQGFLDYYQTTLPQTTIDATWARLMERTSPMKARVIVQDSELLGFAIHSHHPSTWVPGDDCYLEDLFVTDAARGRGLGRALIDDLIVLARARGWHRLYWHTNTGNLQARALYDSYVKADGHIRYRMTL